MAKYANIESMIKEVMEDRENDPTIFHDEIERKIWEAEYDFAISTLESVTYSEDTIEIVHCKDCKHFKSRSRKNNYGLCDCPERQTNANAEFYPFAEDFCSYGEEREKF